MGGSHEYRMEWQRKNRPSRHARNKAILNIYKHAAGCADCGFRDYAGALDFDHVRGVKLFSVSKKANNRLETLMSEIEKCDVVCANCHRKRTAERGQSNWRGNAKG